MSDANQKQDRVGVLVITASLLEQLLQLPPELRVTAMHIDGYMDSVLLRLEGPSMPPRPPPGQSLARVMPTYVKYTGPEGDFVSLEKIEVLP